MHVLTGGAGASDSSAELPYTDYDYQGLKVHAVGRPGGRSPVERIRDEYASEPIAEHVRGYVEGLRPDAIHIFNLFNLSGSLLEVFEEAEVPVVFTPTSFWPVCKQMTLTKPDGTLCSGPDELTANCLECWGAEKHAPPETLPHVQETNDFYRKLARSALSAPQDFPSVWTMLQRNRYLLKWFNRAVDVVLSPNEFMTRKLTEHGLDPSLFRHSPYGIDTSGFAAARTVRSTEGLRVGFIGSINRLKGLHVLIEAFKTLPPESGASLRVCGGLDGWPDYAREVYELACGDPRINFAGPFPNEETADELSRMDVLVVPSVWHENTPLVVYAAFAASVPVIASATGGLDAVVRHEENGLLFEPGDAGDLSAQLRRLVDEPGLIEKLGSRAGEVRGVRESVDEMLEFYERPRSLRPGHGG